MHKSEFLKRALELVTNDRNVTHGDAKKNLEVFAEYVSTYLTQVHSDVLLPGAQLKLDATDASIIMCLFKVHRIGANKLHFDSYDDLLGYGAIAGEVSGAGNTTE